MMTGKQAIVVLEDRIITSKELGEHVNPVSDYDVFVNEQYQAMCIALESLKKQEGVLK